MIRMVDAGPAGPAGGATSAATANPGIRKTKTQKR